MTNTQTQSRLMTIPGELRNRIYRYAILQEAKLKVTAAGYERSPLFLVCKAVREEVLEIYYYETSFQVVMPQYDTTVLSKFLNVVRAAGLEIGTNCEDDFKFKNNLTCYFKPQGSPHWANFLHWMYLSHSRQAILPRQTARSRRTEGENRAERLVLAGIISVIRRSMQRDWKDVEMIVNDFRPALEAIDERWQDGPLSEEAD